MITQMKTLNSSDIVTVSGGISEKQIVSAARFISKGARVGGPVGFAVGVVIGIGLEVYERWE